MKDWLFIRYITDAGCFSIEMDFGAPAIPPTRFALGHSELRLFIKKAEAAIGGECPHMTVDELQEEYAQADCNEEKK